MRQICTPSRSRRTGTTAACWGRSGIRKALLVAAAVRERRCNIAVAIRLSTVNEPTAAAASNRDGQPAGSLRVLAGRMLPVIGFVLLFACDEKKLPTAPSELTTGIVVYQHANYLGESAHLTTDVKNLEDFTGPCDKSDGSGDTKFSWGDCISSVRLAPGWQATLYKDDSFEDDQLQVTEDIPNLTFSRGDCAKGGFNDCTSSLRVFQP